MAQAKRDPNIGAIKEDIAALKKTIEDLADEFNRAGDTALDQAAERVSETVNRLRTQLNEAVQDVTERGRRSAETVTTSVSERPIQSLMVAFAAGMIIAQFLKRR
jgi:ElaB/YqjD/DUF883 family membrane-anchored ribosome-binding protein